MVKLTRTKATLILEIQDISGPSFHPIHSALSSACYSLFYNTQPSRTCAYWLAEIHIAFLMRGENLTWARDDLCKTLRNCLNEQIHDIRSEVPIEVRNLTVVAFYLHQKIWVQRAGESLKPVIDTGAFEEAFLEALIPIGKRIDEYDGLQQWQMKVTIPSLQGLLATAVGTPNDLVCMFRQACYVYSPDI